MFEIIMRGFCGSDKKVTIITAMIFWSHLGKLEQISILRH